MIKIQRLTKPTKLNRNEDIWTKKLCNARSDYYSLSNKFHTTSLSHPNANSDWYAHPNILHQLQKMTHSKCAYCEGEVNAVSWQHIEHFRPQSIYPYLAYRWDNLLLACGRCNSAHKGNQFPLQDGSQPTENQSNPCSLDGTDAHMLINPCDEDPCLFFTFVDERIVCRNARGVKMREVCGLDRDALNDARKMWIPLVEGTVKAYLLAVQFDKSNDVIEMAEILRSAVMPDKPYSAMIRAKIESMGIVISSLP